MPPVGLVELYGKYEKIPFLVAKIDFLVFALWTWCITFQPFVIWAREIQLEYLLEFAVRAF